MNRIQGKQVARIWKTAGEEGREKTEEGTQYSHCFLSTDLCVHGRQFNLRPEKDSPEGIG